MDNELDDGTCGDGEDVEGGAVTLGELAVLLAAAGAERVALGRRDSGRWTVMATIRGGVFATECATGTAALEALVARLSEEAFKQL